MEEAEAEAILRALGNGLEWQNRGLDNCLAEAESKNHQGEHYSIRFDPARNGFQAVWWPAGDRTYTHPMPYKSRIDAKAACQHHHDTRKWE